MPVKSTDYRPISVADRPKVSMIPSFSKQHNIIYDGSKMRGLRTIKHKDLDKSHERSNSSGTGGYDPRVGISSDVGDGGQKF